MGRARAVASESSIDVKRQVDAVFSIANSLRGTYQSDKYKDVIIPMIITNGSPLFSGGTISGESQVRRWLLENDYVEAIIGMPTDLFYNTGIGIYIWVISRNKRAERRGKVQLIDATDIWEPMRRSLGKKRKFISDLFENTRRRLSEASNSPSAEKAVECLFKSAIFPANVFTKIDGVNEKTGRRLLSVLRDDMGVVKEIAPHSGQRPAVLVFPQLLEIVEGIKFRE